MIVCVCNRLNESRIWGAIDAGAQTPEAVYSGCGVKRNCGRCQETIAEMLDAEHKAQTLDKAA
jgi:bacterioferritin-associated ferredoxin